MAFLTLTNFLFFHTNSHVLFSGPRTLSFHIVLQSQGISLLWNAPGTTCQSPFDMLMWGRPKPQPPGLNALNPGHLCLILLVCYGNLQVLAFFSGDSGRGLKVRLRAWVKTVDTLLYLALGHSSDWLKAGIDRHSFFRVSLSKWALQPISSPPGFSYLLSPVP